MLNIQLELNKPLKICSNSLDISYINKCDRNADIEQISIDQISNKLTMQSMFNNNTGQGNTTNSITDFNKCRQLFEIPPYRDSTTLAAAQYSVASGIVKNINNGCDAVKENIVARIIADFAECETDYPSQEKIPRLEKPKYVPNKYFEELVITCSGSTSIENINTNGYQTEINNKNEAGSSSGAEGILEKTLSEPTPNKVRLLNHRSNRIISKTVSSMKLGSITTVDLQGNTADSLAHNTKTMDKAAKAYEFSEDTEKYEKISIFRKRRLADKKYEFSEDNAENIIPFTKLRLRNKTLALRTKANKSAASLSPSPHSNTVYNSTSIASATATTGNGDHIVQTHTHRASPSHGFRSPCGSPVGNRFIMSPPGGRASSLYGKSPTYSKPFSSPRQFPKRTYFELTDNNFSTNALLSPRSDEFEVFKAQQTVQPLTEVKPSNIDATGVHSPAATIMANEKMEKDKPTCSKKLIRRYVEEDDATSVITSEEGLIIFDIYTNICSLKKKLNKL